MTFCPRGSSPHTWGILTIQVFACWWPRFIPTYVGHTIAGGAIGTATSVHPHIRGAYHIVNIMQEKYSGSSPHTWGILLTHKYMTARCRFIPTYVGHTESNQLVLHLINGSSPHTWGILPLSDGKTARTRFIPTYVGHTQCLFLARGKFAVHPHIRGAYRFFVWENVPGAGSSPHTWGIRNDGISVPGKFRFIPTYVGHTLEEMA